MPRPEFDEAVLASHASGLRSLALSILRDREAAEDVVQETWARALVAPAPSGPGLAGWLRVVARGLALNRLRDERHRRERETAMVRERRGPPDEDDERRAEALRSVVDAVLLLDEPYRRVILARYFDGLEPAEIAARTGAPVATIATRLKRARERLRERLERDVGVEGLPGALALVAGLDPRTVTLPPVVPFARMKLASGVALLVLLAAGIWWIAHAPPQAGAREELAAEPAPLGDPRAAAVLAEQGASAGTKPSAHQGARSEERDASLSAHDARPRPAPRVGDSSPSVFRRDQGSFLFHLVVEALDRDLHPMAGVLVLGAPRSGTPNELGATDWRGRLEREWRGFEPVIELELQARDADEGASPLVRVRLEHDHTTELRLALRSPGAVDPVDAMRQLELAGLDPDEVERVLAEARQRARKERERARKSAKKLPASDDRSAFEPEPAPRFELDALGNGVFVEPLLLADASSGPARSQTTAPASRSARESATTVRTSDERMELVRVAKRGFAVEIALSSALGEPARDVPVSLACAAPMLRLVERTDAEGRVRFDAPFRGRAQLTFGAGAWLRVDEELEILDGPVRLQRTLVASQTMPVRLVSSSGVACSEWVVEAWTGSGVASLVAAARTDALGAAVLGLPPGGPWKLLARKGAASAEPAALAHAAVWGSRTEERFAIESALDTGAVDVLFVGTNGRRLAHPRARLWDPAAEQGIELDSAASSTGGAEGVERVFHSPRVRSGIYVLEAGAEGQRWSSFGEVRVPAGKTLDLGRVAFRENAALDIAPGALPDDLAVSLEFRVFRGGALVRCDPMTARLPVRFDAAPGRCELVVRYTAPAPTAPLPGAPGAPTGASSVDAEHRTAIGAPTSPPSGAGPASSEPRVDVFALELSPGGAERVELRAEAPRPQR